MLYIAKHVKFFSIPMLSAVHGCLLSLPWVGCRDGGAGGPTSDSLAQELYGAAAGKGRENGRGGILGLLIHSM